MNLYWFQTFTKCCRCLAVTIFWRIVGSRWKDKIIESSLFSVMSGSSRRTTSAVALEELKRRRDLESLRKYLINEQCFPATKDPMTSVITMEELKKLARIWKLNERRNFWKTHSERNEMVAALLEHAEQNSNILSLSTKNILKGGPSVDLTPMPPLGLRSSDHNSKNVKGIRNYCGKKYFNRITNHQELLVSSRFFDFPQPEAAIDHVVDVWRTEDFNLKDELSASNIANRAASLATQNMGRNTIAKGVARNKVKMQKLRNLALHLLNYSASVDLTKNPLNVKSVQTFINVAETDDIKVVSNCTIALSNISSNEQVRAMLLEINAMHKITGYLQYIKGASTQWAAALLFYYFSCDKESEDRIYNACSAFAQLNGLSKEMDTRMVALYTMNNLMPCIDRQRVVEIAMKIIMSMFDLDSITFDKNLILNALLCLQNMSCFSNTHTTLFSLNITGLLQYFANVAVHHKNPDLGLGVVKVLHAFLYLSEQAANIISEDFIEVLIILFAIDHELLLVQLMRAAAALSAIPALADTIRATSLISTIAQMVTKRPQISNNLAKDVVKFFCNITLNQSDASLERLVADGVTDAILIILKSTTISNGMKCTVIRALQNILKSKANCVKLAELCLDPLIKLLRDLQDIGAAHSLYNIACIPECRASLVENKVHFKMLELLTNAKDLQVKSAYLQILVQMSSSNVCVQEMLGLDLITKLETQLKKGQNKDVWEDISTMLLAVVAFAAKDLSEKDQSSIVHILGIICIKGSTDDMIENCANVLKYVSVRFGVFEELNPVVRAMLALSDSEEVIESLSTVLYNMTCSGRNVVLMLQDDQYVNIMIRIMRSGKLEVQENIAQAMRTLCANERCTQILLKNDILSDLIVVALLRTSSEEIKVVCSEAFYNMLCHYDTRLRLLRGDLWWAVMRLCRTDSDHVRKICARTLFDLSCDAENVAPLRDHHVISFIKDISTSGNEEFLTKCLHAVHNLLKLLDNDSSNPPIATYEVISCVRIGADALSRCGNINHVREALILLLKCAQHDLSNGVDQEFINLDIVEALTTTKQLWGLDYECKLYVSRLLWELSKSGSFTKSCSLSDLDAVLLTVYSPDAPDSEITDNIAAVFLQFVLREKVPPLQIITLAIWNKLLNESLGTSHSRMATPIGGANSLLGLESSVRTPRGFKQRPSVYKGESLNALDFKDMQATSASSGLYLPFATRGSILSVLAYSVKEHLGSSQIKISRTLVKGILTFELLDNPLTRHNLLRIIHALSEVSEFTQYMVESDVFRLLSRYLSNSYGSNKQSHAQEFCSTFLRNISLHSAVFSNISELDGSIDDLVQEILEVPNPNVIMDVSIFFFNSATLLTNGSPTMSPTFVLTMINKITAMDTDKDSVASNINKTTISIILNSYPFDNGVDPSFVQSMYNYMQTNPASEIPEVLRTLAFKDNEMHVTLMPDLIKSRPSLSVPLVMTPADENQWIPTSSVTQRCNQNIILKFTQAQPAVYDRLEAADGFAPPTFTKIIKQFERVTFAMLNMENLALVEVEDEDKEDDTEDDTTSASLRNESSILREQFEKGQLNPDEIQMLLTQANNQENEETEEGHRHTGEGLVISAELAYGSRSPPLSAKVAAGSTELNFPESTNNNDAASSAGYSQDGFHSETAVQGEEK